MGLRPPHEQALHAQGEAAPACGPGRLRRLHPLVGPRARASDPSGSSNSSNQAARRETARTGRAIRQAGHPGARGVWRPIGLPQADRRVEGPPPILERRNDDRRPQRHGARDGSLEADLERRSASAHQTSGCMCTETPFPCACQRFRIRLVLLQLRHGRRNGVAAPGHAAVDGSDHHKR